MFCQLAQKTGILFDEMVCLISWKISIPELDYSNQDWMIFSAYQSLQAFFSISLFSSFAQNHEQQKKGKFQLHICFTIDTKLSERSLM